jgi:hypothetical protein
MMQRPVDDNHALLIGAVAGVLTNLEEVDAFTYTGIRLIDDDEGYHLDTIEITAPSGRYLVHVEKAQ